MDDKLIEVELTEVDKIELQDSIDSLKKIYFRVLIQSFLFSVLIILLLIVIMLIVKKPITSIKLIILFVSLLFGISGVGIILFQSLYRIQKDIKYNRKQIITTEIINKKKKKDALILITKSNEFDVIEEEYNKYSIGDIIIVEQTPFSKMQISIKKD